MPNFTFTERDHAILDAALSFMYSNLDEVNEQLETDFTETEVDDLRNNLANEDEDTKT